MWNILYQERSSEETWKDRREEDSNNSAEQVKLLINITSSLLIINFSEHKKPRNSVVVIKSRTSMANQQHYNIKNIYSPDTVNTLKNQLGFLQWQGCLHMLWSDSREQSLQFPTNSSAQLIKHFVSHLIMIVFKLWEAPRASGNGHDGQSLCYQPMTGRDS